MDLEGILEKIPSTEKLLGLIWIVSWILAIWVYHLQFFLTGLFCLFLIITSLHAIDRSAFKKEASPETMIGTAIILVLLVIVSIIIYFFRRHKNTTSQKKASFNKFIELIDRRNIADEEETLLKQIAFSSKLPFISELLTNREYASKLSLRSTGNARADSYLSPPIIRMRSTFFEQGDWLEDEIFEDINFGYYCADLRGGQAQMNASFQVGIQEAYEIVEGELGSPVTDLSISGIATDSLFKIEGISKGDFLFGAGRCGKGQEAFTSDGGPNTRFSEGGITFGGKT